MKFIQYSPLHVIAIADIVDCAEMIDDFRTLANGQVVTGTKLAFGDFSQGRYAWVLDNVQSSHYQLKVQKTLEWAG